MVPMLGREIIERRQSLAVLGQAGCRLLIFFAVFLDEDIQRGLGGGTGLSLPDLAQVGFDCGLEGLGDLVQHVRSLVNPAALVPVAGEYLVECLPEPERTVADSDFLSAGQAAPLEVDK
ncbi:hypothetical protein SAMN05421759_11270 [Roseivivax lentus]|uniref:Uncharacterized protein n=1 Tax=Roseivivax lentus TaxID=633194 RepID=A0A1N7P3Y9_9RHOB|nr:hypothetical protein SAMN05421759_11270 [Roseivivax lentus]